jgi:transportin-3
MIKVIYDLNQLPSDQLPLLRDTLVSTLRQYSAGPRNILVQICLALSALSVQMGDWAPHAVHNLIETLGTVPATVPGLLQFLAVLPDDVSSNARIPISVSYTGSPLGPAESQRQLDRTMNIEHARSYSLQTMLIAC